MNKVRILNVEFDNVSEQELLEQLTEGVLVTPNIDHLAKLQKDESFYGIVNRAEWVICDSKIIFLASKLLNRPLKEAIPGSGFFPHFYMYHKDDPNMKIFLLGAKDGVADKAMQQINQRLYDEGGRDRALGDMVIGAYSPSFGFEKSEAENEQICQMIRESSVNVVLVGVGCPKQEKWIDAHKAQMPNVKIWMALGATIDFEAGNVKRAPKIFQKTATEWLYRLFAEPKRMYKRYLIDDPPILLQLIKDKFGKYKNPFKE